VVSAVKSDHKAIVAYNGPQVTIYNKRKEQRVFRKRSPTQHALFLEYASQMKIELANEVDVQRNFDEMYSVMKNLLERFYPERRITVTSTDPRYVTPAVKAILRRKNRLMRAGRIEEAGALARRVRDVITRQNSSWLRNINTRKNARDAWAKVREIIGKKAIHDAPGADGITAQVLNNHYAAVSTDRSYQESVQKQTASSQCHCITEIEVFHILDRLRPTATGLDDIPAWFLRLGAPIFAAPIAQLINQSVTAGVVPNQWKRAIITPVPKVSKPMQPSDFRPISITPVLSRSFEKYMVRSYIYPALQEPTSGLYFADQFGFRPTGSTTAALIALFHTILTMLSTNPFVRVIALDFSKAFDTVRHATLIDKMAQLQMPDQVFNWIKAFFDGHSHCTRYSGEVSAYADIQASVIQGSGLGPAAYVVTAADLRPKHDGNVLIKFADDTYMILPAENSGTCIAELAHIDDWAERNNLRLNCAKTKEIIVRANGKRGQAAQLPPPCDGIERVSSLTALGVVINDQMTATDHVSSLLASCSRLLYALRVLRGHGIPAASMNDIFRSTVIAKLLYCAPAWSGFCSAKDRTRLDAFLRRCRRLGYCGSDISTVAELFDEADETLFHRILANNNHVLQSYLPDRSRSRYNLRTGAHSKELIVKTTQLNDRDFFIRMLYKKCY